MLRHISTLQRLLTALPLLLALVGCNSAVNQSPPLAGRSPTASAPAVATVQGVTSTAAPPPPTAMPATAAPMHITAPAPAASPTALPPEPTALATPIALLSLPTPNHSTRNEPLPPPAWLIAGDTAVLSSLGGFQYTIDLGGGSVNPATRDAGPPDANSNVASVTLPATARAVLVIGAAGIKEVRVTLQPWPPDPNGASVSERERAVIGHPEGDAMVYVLEPTGAAADQLLSVSVRFAGGIHEGDYAAYYWRLSPAAAST